MRSTAKGLTPGKPVRVRKAGARRAFSGTVSKRPPLVIAGKTVVDVVDGRTGGIYRVPACDVRLRR